MLDHNITDKTRRTFCALLGLLACVAAPGLAGCVEVGIPADGNKPHAELNPIQGMHASPAFKDQELQIGYDDKRGAWIEQGMQTPPPETIHERYRPYRYAENPEQAKALKNPVGMSTESLRYGKLLYETNCVVCHGPSGHGNGYVVGTNKYPQPPTLNSQRVRTWEDAEIYHVITNGQGRMWSYKNNLYPLERWAVVNYVRALQRADYPEPQDLERVRSRDLERTTSP